jgi:hypothetical protein
MGGLTATILVFLVSDSYFVVNLELRSVLHLNCVTRPLPVFVLTSPTSSVLTIVFDSQSLPKGIAGLIGKVSLSGSANSVYSLSPNLNLRIFLESG